MDSEENHFADWVISNVGNHTALADTMRSAAVREDGSVLLMFLPDVEDQLDQLKGMIVDRFMDMAAEADDPDFDGYKLSVDAQQVEVYHKTHLLLKVRDTGRK